MDTDVELLHVFGDGLVSLVHTRPHGPEVHVIPARDLDKVLQLFLYARAGGRYVRADS